MPLTTTCEALSLGKLGFLWVGKVEKTVEFVFL